MEKKNKKHLEYQKEYQKKRRKELNLPLRLRALKSWRTRREEGWETAKEILNHFDMKKEIKRLNKEINELEPKIRGGNK